ncbi:hypothetical protein GC175_28215 [bacterium]|nr:hypothetical protein [bacterium]
MENPTTQTAAIFRETYPLEFDLYDENGHPVLYIEDDQIGHNLALVIRNTSTLTLGLTSADNFPFELRFRPGTLSNDAVDRLRIAEAGWSWQHVAQADGTDSIFLNPAAAASALDPNASLTVTLQNVSAAAAGGARGTRVELRYQQLTTGTGDVVTGNRLRHLSIVNSRGRRTIPLHAGFLDGNTILNDGATANNLSLRLTNALRNGSITLNPAGSEAPTRFILSFDSQPEGEEIEWALGTTAQVEAIEVGFLDGFWEVRQETEGESPVWILTPQEEISLPPGEHVELFLAGIISSLPTGHTNLYLHYQNIPGYGDGQFIAGIEKAPLIYRHDRVGIGTADPDYTLDVRGHNVLTDPNARYNSHFPFTNNQAFVTGDKVILRGGAPQNWQPLLTADGENRHVGIGTSEPAGRLQIINANQDATGNTLILGPTTQANLRLGYDQEYSWIQSHGGRPLAINPIGNNVGIGTITPETRVHIRGGSDPTLKIQSNGTNENSGRVSLRQSNDTGADMVYDGRSATEGLAFHLTHNEGGLVQVFNPPPPPVFFLSNHAQRFRHVGINTSTPTARLHVNNDSAAVPALLLVSPNASSWQFRIHNLAQPTFQVGMRVTNDGFFDVTNRANLSNPQSARLNNSGTWTVASDRRFKEEIQPVHGILDKIMALQPVSFRYKGMESEGPPLVGFIAQDVEAVFPHLVTGSEDKYLDYAGFGPLAISAIQEMKQEYDDRIVRLEETVARLLARLEGRGNEQ